VRCGVAFIACVARIGRGEGPLVFSIFFVLLVLVWGGVLLFKCGRSLSE